MFISLTLQSPHIKKPQGAQDEGNKMVQKKLPRLAPFVRGKTLLNFFTIPSTGFGSRAQCEDVTLTCFKTIDHYTGNFFTNKGKIEINF